MGRFELACGVEQRAMTKEKQPLGLFSEMMKEVCEKSTKFRRFFVVTSRAPCYISL